MRRQTPAGRELFTTAEWLHVLLGLALTPVAPHLTNIQFYERQLAMRVIRALLPLAEPSHSAVLALAGPGTSADSKSTAVIPAPSASGGAVLLTRLLDIIGDYTLSTVCSPLNADTSLVSGVAASDLVALFRKLLSTAQWNAVINALLEEQFQNLSELRVQDMTNSVGGSAGQQKPAVEEETTAHLKPGMRERLGRVLAALWIMGGGTSPIGEGTRVYAILGGDDYDPNAECATGIVLRMPTSRFRASLVQAPVLNVNKADNKKSLKALLRLDARHTLTAEGARSDSASTKRKGVVEVSITQLRAIDEVEVPLSQLTDGGSIVQCMASFLRALQAPDSVAVLSSPTCSLLGATLATNLQSRICRVLNLFVQNRALSTCMMQSAIGPVWYRWVLAPSARRMRLALIPPA